MTRPYLLLLLVATSVAFGAADPCKKGEVRVAALAAYPVTTGKTVEERKKSQAKAILDLLDKAPKDSRLLVLPEAILTPLPEDATEFKDATQAAEFALVLPGLNREPTEEPFSKIADIAFDRKAFIHVPVFEKADGKVYNTVIVLGPDRKVHAKHRKVNLYASEKKYLTAGTHGATTYDGSKAGLGTVGVAICADIYESSANPHLMEKYRTAGIDLMAVSSEWMEAKDSEKGPTKDWTPENFANEAWQYLNHPEAIDWQKRYATKKRKRADRETALLFSNTTKPAPWTSIARHDGKIVASTEAAKDEWTEACITAVAKIIAVPKKAPAH